MNDSERPVLSEERVATGDDLARTEREGQSSHGRYDSDGRRDIRRVKDRGDKIGLVGRELGRGEERWVRGRVTEQTMKQHRSASDSDRDLELDNDVHLVVKQEEVVEALVRVVLPDRLDRKSVV